MEISDISKSYHVRKMSMQDIDAIYDLSIGNPLFYRYCPPFITKQSIIEDLSALPPNVSIENKYYIGYFKDQRLIAIMDLILGYPHPKTAYIGLFMVDKSIQGMGIGSKMILECSGFLKGHDFQRIRLAYAKGNMQSRSFWSKNQFKETGEIVEKEDYAAVLMEKEL